MKDRFNLRFFIENKIYEVLAIDYDADIIILKPLNIGEPTCFAKTKDGKLLQCTGLKDKNGKLIYEGDILKDRSNRNIRVVVWEQDCFKYPALKKK